MPNAQSPRRKAGRAEGGKRRRNAHRPGARVGGRRLFAGPDFDIQGQPEVSDEVGVIGVRGAPRFVGIVPTSAPS